MQTPYGNWMMANALRQTQPQQNPPVSFGKDAELARLQAELAQVEQQLSSLK